MIIQAMIGPPPLSSPCVSSMAMREPPGVVYQLSASGLGLSVDLNTPSGMVIPFTASTRAMLSSNRQAAMLMPSMVPPEW